MESLYNIAILGSLKFYWCCSSCHPIWLLDLRQDFAMLPPTSTLIILVFMTHNSRNKTQQPTYYSTGSQVSTVSRKKLSIPWGTSTLNEKGHRSKLSYIAYYVHLKSTLFMQDNFIIMSFCCVDEICSALYSKKLLISLASRIFDLIIAFCSQIFWMTTELFWTPLTLVYNNLHSYASFIYLVAFQGLFLYFSVICLLTVHYHSSNVQKGQKAGFIYLFKEICTFSQQGDFKFIKSNSKNFYIVAKDLYFK